MQRDFAYFNVISHILSIDYIIWWRSNHESTLDRGLAAKASTILSYGEEKNNIIDWTKFEDAIKHIFLKLNSIPAVKTQVQVTPSTSNLFKTFVREWIYKTIKDKTEVDKELLNLPLKLNNNI